MSARRRTLAERRADRFVGARAGQGRRKVQKREGKPRTRPVPHPFELPNIGVRSH